MAKSSDLNLFLTTLFFASFLGKIGLKTGAKVGAKTAAKTGAKVGTKVASKIGLKAGIGIGAVGLFSISNVFQGDGLLGGIGDVLGLSSVTETMSTMIYVVIGIVILFLVIKIFGGKR